MGHGIWLRAIADASGKWRYVEFAREGKRWKQLSFYPMDATRVPLAQVRGSSPSSPRPRHVSARRRQTLPG